MVSHALLGVAKIPSHILPNGAAPDSAAISSREAKPDGTAVLMPSQRFRWS